MLTRDEITALEAAFEQITSATETAWALAEQAASVSLQVLSGDPLDATTRAAYLSGMERLAEMIPIERASVVEGKEALARAIQRLEQLRRESAAGVAGLQIDDRGTTEG
jgi:hypothetical protein